MAIMETKSPISTPQRDAFVLANISKSNPNKDVYLALVSTQPAVDNSTNTTTAQRDESLARLEVSRDGLDLDIPINTVLCIKGALMSVIIFFKLH
ncbi:hypothetical protein ElyMa_006730800 [Elysia marginata]|uniref:Uncharacterized protein n=1 Tax=Elysia marginata TaxID=1093978 RepID=A0AAV4IWI6_9GAST|nr:hypothetical protein ElyMa_006730800 [Elysia marginata]